MGRCDPLVRRKLSEKEGGYYKRCSARNFLVSRPEFVCPKMSFVKVQKVRRVWRAGSFFDNNVQQHPVKALIVASLIDSYLVSSNS
jgi:hypothetical protein